MKVGRSLSREGREVTLRAVAAEMGLTAPALYRYVGSVAALNELLANDIFTEVVGEMAAAAQRYGDDDPAAQIVAAATAFRAWALDHPAEFQLVFVTTSLSGDHVTGSHKGRPRHPPAPITTGTTTDGVQMFADFFGGIFAKLAQQSSFPVPDVDELDETFVAVHSGSGKGGTADLMAMLGKDELGLMWQFELAWAQLHGIVALEVYGHIRTPLIRSGAVFRAVMKDIGARVGMTGDWQRLTEVSRQVIADRS
ncbi:TetR/AcrR family transcriptional regulator [Streptomyces calidiresistens]|uniref:HTH-type transcriptional regulator MT1864/Rv1816-like C-terminal domain-containing protein n=1 Tax=Streptomyces calidiresistens TaxID=1485586 RepID=A0A7W3XUQ7_9ACTN|nr:WHG domain-containing protein [Streptomyces calidiresistens]MBB0227961.1 hypothetical protein [Streptomyces calidiresistens]